MKERVEMCDLFKYIYFFWCVICDFVCLSTISACVLQREINYCK